MSTRQIYKIFVGNLPWTISRKELKLCMQQFGQVKSAQVVFNRENGMNRGFGFVEFGTMEGKEAAMAQTNVMLEGNKLQLGTGKRIYSPMPTLK
ncbi:SRA stem-loop-interacting RNA-binding protein, mitochondrial-like [Tubulanus polymorphus]|uniref:SRA stem-loop-interacting RNA-binding protein, mitochondrial-like n=1 Tax=Tubulanus polymorphus TaxID=672921 RepID=UPI003DA2550D